MICFEVKKNGERVCVAGVDSECVLSTIVNYINVTDPGPTTRRVLDVYVGGLNTASQQHLKWATVDLVVGDRVEVSIVESEKADPPTWSAPPRPPAQEATEVLGRLRARRKALNRELKQLDRDEARYLKTLAAEKKRAKTKKP
jgi:hypothetical protein